MVRICAPIVRSLLVAMLAAAARAESPPRFELVLDPKATTQPYSGRVYLVLSSTGGGNPIDRVNWFSTEPLYSVEVKDWKPGDSLIFDAARARFYPTPIAELPAGKWFAQASIDLNRVTFDVLRGGGNAFSQPVEFAYDPANAATEVKLKLSETRPHWKPRDLGSIKFEIVKSALLSKYLHRDVQMKAAVCLPEGYAKEEAAQQHPAVYVVSGFGGTLRDATGMLMWMQTTLRSPEFQPIVIYIDADCPNGHHVWADSANNGPWGTALVEELIPHLEKSYRLIPDADARYITGVSSGGWASLWAQITHPDYFGGVWSCSPDPVDFSAFQTIDIYDPTQNFLTMPDGSPRPITRGAGRGALLVKPFSQLEETLGRGGQLQSFDAVFGPRATDGSVTPLWDRATGKIDANVAEYWKRYDIRLILERDWKTLGPKLAGKLYLYCGDADSFFLEAAFNKLTAVLKKLGSDAYTELMPGVPHTVTPQQMTQMAEQMRAQFQHRYLNRKAH